MFMDNILKVSSYQDLFTHNCCPQPSISGKNASQLHNVNLKEICDSVFKYSSTFISEDKIQ